MFPAIAATTLIGGAGLSVDTVQWYLWKRQLQQEVDSAALAGGQSIRQGMDSEKAALRELYRNGNKKLSLSRISNPPQEGDYTGDTLAMEVSASIRQPLPFSSLFLDTPPNINARAVAATVIEGTHCVIALARTGIGVSATGSAEADLDCGVASNSRDSAAIKLGGSSYVKASPFSAVGGIEYEAKHIERGSDMIPYTIPQIDPIQARGLSVPSSPSGCTANNFTVGTKDTVTIEPGRYCNGLTVRGELTMAPGIYIVDRGTFKVNSQATIRGEGVTIVLTGSNANNVATVDFVGGAHVDLRAPSYDEDSSWYSILFFQDSNANYQDNKFSGNSDFDMEGVLYFPKGNITFTGSSGQHSQCLLLISYRVTFQGNSSLRDDCPESYDSVDNGARRVKIVE